MSFIYTSEPKCLYWVGHDAYSNRSIYFKKFMIYKEMLSEKRGSQGNQDGTWTLLWQKPLGCCGNKTPSPRVASGSLLGWDGAVGTL